MSDPNEPQTETMSALDMPTDEHAMARGQPKTTNPQALLGGSALRDTLPPKFFSGDLYIEDAERLLQDNKAFS